MLRLPRNLAAITVVSFSIAVTVHGATPKNSAKPDPGRDAVRNVLRAEVAGPVDRRAQLANAIETTPDSAMARWQAGYVRTGGDWRSFADSARAALSGESLLAYRQQRARAQRTAADQLKLADWCRARNLPDQERAHLVAALVLGAGDAVEPIAARLGYRQIGGRWLSHEQLLEWSELNRRAEQSLKKWEPQLTKLAERLARSTAQREQVVAGLKKSVDPSAVAAIEYVLAGRDEESALVAIELLRLMEGFEASLALARQAVFSPWEAVRKSAGAALPGRPLDDFIPDLLGLLRTPIKSDLQVFSRWDMPGVLLYNLILARETENQFQVAVLTTVGHAIDVTTVVEFRRNASFRQGSRISPSGTLGLTDLDRMIRDSLRPREEAVDRENDLVEEINRRVSRTLQVASGQAAPADPQTWWRWWAEYSDVDYREEKSVAMIREYDDVVLPTQYLELVVTLSSCFAAGTPVWTESGLRPIESVATGDRVLAKNVETGELEYKPVLHTTIRPPRPTVQFRAGDEAITCTGGHRFWVSGTGWVKARDLKTPSLLHTATGTAPVWSARPEEPAKTYNLVVADFHTYFVGPGGLCQDLLHPQKTDRLVPGLARTLAAAKSN